MRFRVGPSLAFGLFVVVLTATLWTPLRQVRTIFLSSTDAPRFDLTVSPSLDYAQILLDEGALGALTPSSSRLAIDPSTFTRSANKSRGDFLQLAQAKAAYAAIETDPADTTGVQVGFSITLRDATPSEESNAVPLLSRVWAIYHLTGFNQITPVETLTGGLEIFLWDGGASDETRFIVQQQYAQADAIDISIKQAGRFRIFLLTFGCNINLDTPLNSFCSVTAPFASEFVDILMTNAPPPKPPATLDVKDSILVLGLDERALVPLHDWMPLLQWKIFSNSIDIIPEKRVISLLDFRITRDPKSLEMRMKDNFNDPRFEDILEFAIFQDIDISEGEIESGDFLGDVPTTEAPPLLIFERRPNGDLVVTGGSLMVRPDALLGTSFIDYITGTLGYTLDFIGTGNSLSAEFKLGNLDGIPAGSIPAGFVLAFRTSPTWQDSSAIGVAVRDARMNPYRPSLEGLPAGDTYIPDFPNGEEILPSAIYLSSFSVFDIAGGPLSIANILQANPFSYTKVLYNPQPEFTRPRFDLIGDSPLETLFETVAGEFMDLRKLIPLEQWIPLIGINLHAVAPQRSDHARYFVEEDMIEVPMVDIREVNLVFTDIGADPDGVPGNGGFNPTTDLENILPGNFLHIDGSETVRWDRAIGQDFAYNGVWLWADTNDSFLFEPPTPDANQGVTLDNDLPYFTRKDLAQRWEYIARPADGGDPQWRITLKLENGIHRHPIEPMDREDFVEEEVDGFNSFFGPVPTNFSYDYFVVIRADSGFTDISGLPGDGTGLRPGADFHAFIEPRRINPRTGQLTGGIYVDAMIPSVGGTREIPHVGPWQEHPQLGDEPWWFERTHRQMTTLPTRHGVEVHDLVLTYESNNDFVNFSSIPFSLEVQGADNLVIVQHFNTWMDPFGVNALRFFTPSGCSCNNSVVPDVQIWIVFIDNNGDIQFISDEESALPFLGVDTIHFPYETVPFFDPAIDDPSVHFLPRSQFYNGDDLPDQPVTPDRSTWPAPPLTPGTYPRQTDWAEANRQARLLKQRIDSDSELTAMLGINLVGADDPFVNAFVTDSVTRISVAFWGPEFSPSDLAPLDPLGIDLGSGVQLWGDVFPDGAFLSNRPFGILEDPLLSGDVPIPLVNLGWRGAAEAIDIDGDGLADDINGDGVVTLADNAWVLDFTPIVPIPIPETDEFNASNPAESRAGDELFVVVHTSNSISAGEKFRALIPVTLPDRLPGRRQGGIRTGLLGDSLPAGVVKSNPEERVVQDFIGHDMIEANIAVTISPLVRLNSPFEPGGPTLAVMGLDLSTNRASGSLETGINTPDAEGQFVDATKAWPNGTLAGKWIVDSLMETFEITDNGSNTLELRSGLPAQGSYRIVRDPSFLEQIVVELYDEGGLVSFNPERDLLPLTADQSTSGIAIYRDNDAHPDNTNGEFDEGIDIPLMLDDAPIFIGRPGEPQMQIKYVFSSPGTDSVPVRIEDQPRLRQWVPHTFGEADIDAVFRGDDFFIVVRPAPGMNPFARFSVGIVSWGPATPTEPDPDTFTFPLPPLQPSHEFDIFSEFPWGSRALGFITFREEPPMEYWMEGTLARSQPELSGIAWTRTTVSKKVRTNTIEVQEEDIIEVGEETIISSASPAVLPDVLGPGETFAVVIRGTRFGALPIVVVDQYLAEITSSSDIEIRILLRGIPSVIPSEPIELSVLNTLSGSLATRNDIFVLESSATLLKVLQVVPSAGSEDAFPVTIIGQSFNRGDNVQVLFGETIMPIIGVSQDGVVIIVDFPAGGLPRTGAIDVEVRGMEGTVELARSVAFGGFFFRNNPVTPGCNASGASSNGTGGAQTGDVFIMVCLGLSLILARRQFVYTRGK